MNPRNQRNLEFFWGIFLILSINIVVMILLWVLVFEKYVKAIGGGDLVTYSIFAFGIDIGQIIYILPLLVWLDILQKGEFIKGVIIGALLTALINFGCCYLFLSMR